MLERGFNRLVSEASALEILLRLSRPVKGAEEVALESADGRVLAEPASAPRDVPHYDRSAMDGYAVRSADTAGASRAGPVRLRVASEVLPLHGVPVQTGSALPRGADAVLPQEDAERDGPRLDVLRRVREGEHVGRRGEDVAAGDLVFPVGHALRPADLGLLRLLGIERVRVRRRPCVGILVTGEELLPRCADPEPGRMVDGNGIMLLAACSRWGGDPGLVAVYSDDPLRIAGELERAAGRSDLVVTSGGTSVGARDQVVEALQAVGEVAFHGVAIQPARPVAAGRIAEVPVVCLPGFPAATFIAAFAFVRPTLARLRGGPPLTPCSRRGRLARKIVSTLGLRSYTRVRLDGDRVEPLRTSGAGVLSSIARADGFVITPENSEGHPEGAEVEVLLLD